VQRCIRHRPNRPQRAVGRNPILGGKVAEHIGLLMIDPAHAKNTITTFHW
jgi:hypothetical protein